MYGRINPDTQSSTHIIHNSQKNILERGHISYSLNSTGYLRGKPLHYMQRSFDQLQGNFHQNCNTDATWAYTTEQYSDDPNEDTN